MWIKAVDNKNNKNIYKGALVFSKEFKLGKNVKKLRLEVSALGILTVSFNDYDIPDYFMPGWTNYKKVVNLCEYDLTDYAKENNIIRITVARGWYSGRLGYIAKDRVYGDDTAVYAEIEATYKNGEKEVITSDETWRCDETNVVFADFFDGERVDFNKRKFKNYAVEKKDGEIPFRKYSYEPVREIERIIPEIISESEVSAVYDFGKNFSGVINFKAKGKAGEVITVKYGEALDLSGGVYTENLRSAKATDRIKLGKGLCEFAPKFTFHGFRFCEVIKTPKCEIIDLYGVVLSQNLAQTGMIEADNQLVNALFKNISNGQASNFISIPTDCPQRDERLGWSGDAQIFCDTAMYNSDCRKFYENYIDLLTDDCFSDGRVPVFVPFFAKPRIEATAAAGWSDAVTVIPLKHYCFYGDKSIIKKCLPFAEKWCEYFHSAEKGRFNKRKIFNYGDWLSAGEVTDFSVVNYCYLGMSLKNLSRMFIIVGNEEKAEFYEREYLKIKDKFLKKCVSGETILSDTQSAYALAFSAGFMTAEEIKDGLSDSVLRADCHLTSGFLGLRYLLPALCEAGRSDLAYKILLQTTYPSWGYEIANGATTIWERWNGIEENGSFFNPSMNSFNHYSLGSVGFWLYAYMLGIRVDEDGITIKPCFGSGINNAKGRFVFRGVKIEVEWKNLGDGYEYSVKTDKTLDLKFDFHNKIVKKQQKNANEYTFALE